MDNIYIKSYLLEMQIRSQSPVTVNCKRYILKYFERFLNAQGVSIEDVTTIIIKEWIASQQAENNGELNNESETRGRKTDKIKSSTINARLKVLKSFYEFLVEEGEIKKSPMEKIKFLKQDKHFVQAYNQKDVKSMLNHYNNKTFLSSRNKLCIMLLASTGIRNGELRGITLDDIKGDCIIIRKAKGGKERVVGIPPIVQKQLMTYLRKRSRHSKSNKSDYLLISQHSGQKLCSRTTLRIINDAGGNVGVHSLRRFFAIQQLEHNDLYSVSRMMGHESIKTTAIYLQSMGDDKIIKKSLEHNPINDLL